MAYRRKQEVNLRIRYGITLQEYQQMYQRQNGLCAICYHPETLTIKGKTVSLAVDHCHTTGKVRGLLCHHCNQSLGHMGDSINVLQNAIRYLKENIDITSRA